MTQLSPSFVFLHVPKRGFGYSNPFCVFLLPLGCCQPLPHLVFKFFLGVSRYRSPFCFRTTQMQRAPGTVPLVKTQWLPELVLLKPVESLGEPGSNPRNPMIAGVLHEMKFAESKGSGIRVMRQLMRNACLLPPTFESEREQDLFTATFFMHHFLDQQDLQWLGHFKDANLSADEVRILIHAREFGSINNAVCRDYMGLDTLAASGMLRRLRDLGLLAQHSRASATYYTPTRQLLHPEERGKGVVEGWRAIDGLPTGLAEAIRNLGQRNPPGQMQRIITELCTIRAYTVDELAVLLRRNKGQRPNARICRVYTSYWVDYIMTLSVGIVIVMTKGRSARPRSRDRGLPTSPREPHKLNVDLEGEIRNLRDEWNRI
jgi:hypothetical protein